ncbi:MAG: hypothetical protein FJ125_09685, partial [Deltaproteobacteria bacterium]|nr:hypothetical protein [Deltaproteobacteria bacterium]
MTEKFIPDKLFAGGVLDVPAGSGTLVRGQNLARGSVLGRVLRALGAAAADPGNAGEGSIDDVALGPKSKVGLYVIECIAAGPPAVFAVLDPDGHRLADAVAGVPYAGQIAFEILPYGDPFDEGDKFTVEVEAGSKQLKLATSQGTDGTEELHGVLADDTDATAAAVPCALYLGGEFNAAALTFAEGDDADTWA